MKESAANADSVAASSSITLSRVRRTYWSTDSGSASTTALIEQMRPTPFAVRGGLGLDPWSAPRENQQTSLCARQLDRRAHERVDQFFEDHLA